MALRQPSGRVGAACPGAHAQAGAPEVSCALKFCLVTPRRRQQIAASDGAVSGHCGPAPSPDSVTPAAAAQEPVAKRTEICVGPSPTPNPSGGPLLTDKRTKKRVQWNDSTSRHKAHPGRSCGCGRFQLVSFHQNGTHLLCKLAELL